MKLPTFLALSLFGNQRPSIMLNTAITTLKVQFGDTSVEKKKEENLRIGLIVGETQVTGVR